MKSWRKLQVCCTDLQLEPTLSGGQSFRWRKQRDSWIGVFKNKVWVLSQDKSHVFYECHESTNFEEEENLLKSYFRLDIDINYHYSCWSESDKYFKETAPKLHGVRILNQEVTENIFSFICSSNNNIKRITMMVEKLCELYGDPIVELNGTLYRSFPAVEKLTGSMVEPELRKAGFGYRAKFIYQSACLIEKLGGESWLKNIKSLPYQEAKKELMRLPGVGAKVADCICLMSLGHLQAVPVDTHIFQVAAKTYLPHLNKYKTLTDKVYNEISDYFRCLHGSYAGWANTVLFCSDLKLLQQENVKKKRDKKVEDIACKKTKVLAKKGSSSEEDRNVFGFGDIPHQAWPYPKPNRGPKPFKFKGKYQVPFVVVGRPEYQNFYPQYPQEVPYYPQVPQEPQVPQGLNPFEVQQYLLNVQKQMQEFSAKAYKEFQSIENEVDRNNKRMQETLKSQFQTLELTLEAKQAKEIQDAIKEGKDESKIQECLSEEEQEVREDMNADIDRTMDCINDATERGRKIVTEARNAYTESSVLSSMQARNWAMKVKSCAEQRDYRCVQEGMSLINDKTKSTVEEGTKYFDNLQEAPRQQMIQLNYCRQNFMDDLRDMKESYSKMVKRCVIASEISKPEEEDDEEDKKVPLDIAPVPELKPELEAEANVEVDA